MKIIYSLFFLLSVLSFSCTSNPSGKSSGSANGNVTDTSSTKSSSSGMSKQQFDAIVYAGKPVLVDFYADWCQPCQKLKPNIDEIAKEQANKLQVLRINADDNRSLCEALNIQALPTLQFYKNSGLAWTHLGYIDKGDIMKQIQ